MKLISKHPGAGGYHPATCLDLPPEGKTFEADDERAAQLVAAGLAVEAKAEKPHAAKREE